GSLARVGGGRLDLLGVRLGLRVAAGLALVGGPVLAGLAGGGAGAAGQQRDGEGGRQQGGGERAKAWHGGNLLGAPRARARGGSWCYLFVGSFGGGRSDSGSACGRPSRSTQASVVAPSASSAPSRNTSYWWSIRTHVVFATVVRIVSTSS